MSSNQTKSAFNLDNTTTIIVRPKLGYGASNKGKNIDKSQSDFHQNESLKAKYNKNRIPTPYPSNVPRPKASHGNRTLSIGPCIRNQPQEFSKEMNTYGNNSVSYPLKACGYQCQIDSNQDIPSKQSFFASLQLPQRSKDKLKEALSDAPYKRRELPRPVRMDLYHACETPNPDRSSKDDSMDAYDCWKYDEENNFDGEVTPGQVKGLHNSDELSNGNGKNEDNLKKRTNIICPEVTESDTKSSFLNEDIPVNGKESIHVIETRITTEKMRQITFERKYGMQYKSFALPKVSRSQETPASKKPVNDSDTKKLLTLDDYQKKLDNLDTWQQKLEQFSNSNPLKGKKSDGETSNSESFDVDTLLKTLGWDNDNEDKNNGDEMVQLGIIVSDNGTDTPSEDITLTEKLIVHQEDEIDDIKADNDLTNKQNMWRHIKQFLVRIGSCKQVPDTISSSSRTELYPAGGGIKESFVNNLRKLFKAKK